MKKSKLIVVTGPTSSGKTKYSIQLAKIFHGEVICCDSMQIYKEMQIGTASPTEKEKDGVPHHLFGYKSVRDKVSCAEYSYDAKKIIEEIISRGNIPILCGGSGLYIDSVIRINDFPAFNPDMEYHKYLQEVLDNDGNNGLHEILRRSDPEAAVKIHPNNTRRVMHALEIIHSSGISKTEYDNIAIAGNDPYDVLMFITGYKDRNILYEHIDKKVDEMINDGLVEEAKELFYNGLLKEDSTAGQAIGYKELYPFFKDEMTLDDAIRKIKESTRHYAKRQMTWNRKYTGAYFLDQSKKQPDEETLNIVDNFIKTKKI